MTLVVHTTKCTVASVMAYCESRALSQMPKIAQNCPNLAEFQMIVRLFTQVLGFINHDVCASVLSYVAIDQCLS